MNKSISPATSTDSPTQLSSTTHSKINAAIDSITTVILGKSQQIRLAVTCLLAQGHLLIEDQPGVGKTTLAHTIAQVMGLAFNRIQFTSDLLPADLLGVSIYSRERDAFTFHPGPVFAHFILADEINRATPKTQSALLEAMAERQVSIEGETRPLPSPFFVIATQNPSTQLGTYELPESQLDRFLMRIHLGYPDKSSERALLMGNDRQQLLEQLSPVLNPAELLQLQKMASDVHVSDAIFDYIQTILEFSRQSHLFESGLSPRGGLALINAAKALACIDQHKYVLPEHVQAVLPAVINHRLTLHAGQQNNNYQDAASCIIDTVPVS